MKNLIIVEDEAIFAELISEYLENHGFNILSIHHNGFDFLDDPKIKEADALLLDLSMPGMSGLEVVKKLIGKEIHKKILVLSTNTHIEILTELHKLGVQGFVHKSKNLSILIEALNVIFNGDHYYSNTSLEDKIHAKREEKIALTERELEIFKLLAKKHTNPEISDKLHISVNTVKTHRKTLYQKLNINSQEELIEIALSKNIL